MNQSQWLRSLAGALALTVSTLPVPAADPGKNGNEIMNVKAGEPPPFIRVREVISSVPFGGWINTDMPLELRHRFFMSFWPEARLRRQLEMLQAFGFNSIQISGNPVMAWWVGADAQDWHRRQLYRCRTARELGMSVSVFIWGAAIPDATVGGQQFVELDWTKPADRARLEAWYREQAEFAPYADRVITHWCDPGGAQPGGIDTIVEMHNAILAIYREKNPKIRGALSTWFMGTPSGTTGYDGPGKLAAHPKLDRNTDIVYGGGIGGDLEAIVAAGRQAAVWGWYTADDEIAPALWVRIGVLEHAFPNKLTPQQRRELAPRWTEGLAWYSLDDCFSGLNMQNLYVAAHLMQDPSRDAQQLLDEFVRGFVGPANAPVVAAALRAVELARTKSDCYGNILPIAVDKRTAEQKQLAAAWLTETTRAVAAAVEGLKTVKLAPGFKPAWPVVLEPQEYLPELQAHLEAIRQMLAFLKAAADVERLKADGVPADKLAAAIDALPKVVYDRAHTAGLEASIYPQKLAALRKAVLGQ